MDWVVRGEEEQVRIRIMKALQSNEHCRIGILDEDRVFESRRRGNQEVLVLLTTKGWGEEIWGHVFLNEGKWVSCLVSIIGYFGGSNNEELLNDFWMNIDHRNGWQSLDQVDDDEHVRISNSLSEALDELIGMIQKFSPECYNQYGRGSYKLMDIYGIDPLINPSKNMKYKN